MSAQTLRDAAAQAEQDADARDASAGGPCDRARWDRDLAARLRSAADRIEHEGGTD